LPGECDTTSTHSHMLSKRHGRLNGPPTRRRKWQRPATVPTGPTHLRLAYTVTPSGGDPTECEYWHPLEYTPCNFGGVRPWFRCPADGCGERVGTLHRPPGRNLFACRECYDIGYLTSRRSGDALKKTELRYQRAFRKVDAKDRRPHPNNAPHWSTKPKDA
jgi:hypothetical protein